MIQDKHGEPQETPQDLEPKGADSEESPAEAPEEQMDPLELMTQERDEYKDRLMRMAAETENYKKRSEREKAEFLKRANQSLLKDLLPVMDNLERALEAAGEGSDAEQVAQGVALVQQELNKLFERHGVERVEALGQPFDPEVHEAMMQQEDMEADENTVLSELQKGYRFYGRLLRPAMVVVSKKPAVVEDDSEEIKIIVS